MSKIKDLCAQLREKRYEVYVLVMCMLAYLVNQLATFSLIASNSGASQEIGYGDRECDVKNSTAVDIMQGMEGTNTTRSDFCQQREYLCDDPVEIRNCSDCCYWRYLGRGVQFQLLAGPLYIVLFAISGLPMGFVAELGKVNRKVCLGICVLVWSVAAMLGGLSTRYWHLVLTRLLTGIFSAGAVPFSASIVSDYFNKEVRGAALGFFNWGIYIGYSLTFTLTFAASNHGWRTVYFIGGAPGILVGVVILATVKEPKRGQADGDAELALGSSLSGCQRFKEALKRFGIISVILSIAGAVRNGAGVCWAYNMVNFFDEYHPGTKIVNWMTWIPLIFGSLGSFGGGLAADSFSKNRGTSFKLVILMSCMLLSAPFFIGTIFCPMPGAFILHIPGYLIGEMWIGVLIAVVVEMTPADLTTSAVAIYIFFIQIIGGNMNLLVTPISRKLGLRLALLITFPGFYIVAALIFIIPFILLRKKEAREMEEQVKSQNCLHIAEPDIVTSSKEKTGEDLIIENTITQA